MDRRALPRLRLRRLHHGRHRRPRRRSATRPSTLVAPGARAVTDLPVCVGLGVSQRRPGRRGRRRSPTASSSARRSCAPARRGRRPRTGPRRSRSSRPSSPTACGAADDPPRRYRLGRRSAAVVALVAGCGAAASGADAARAGRTASPAGTAPPVADGYPLPDRAVHRHRGGRPYTLADEARDAGDPGLLRLHALPRHLQRGARQRRARRCAAPTRGARRRPDALRHAPTRERDTPCVVRALPRPVRPAVSRAWSRRSGPSRRRPRSLVHQLREADGCRRAATTTVVTTAPTRPRFAARDGARRLVGRTPPSPTSARTSTRLAAGSALTRRSLR